MSRGLGDSGACCTKCRDPISQAQYQGKGDLQSRVPSFEVKDGLEQEVGEVCAKCQEIPWQSEIYFGLGSIQRALYRQKMKINHSFVLNIRPPYSHVILWN